MKLFGEVFENLPQAHPGCLTAAYCYQDRQFDRRVRELNAAGILAWRERFRGRLERIAERYPLRMAVNLSDVADMLSALADGGIILSKALNEPWRCRTRSISTASSSARCFSACQQAGAKTKAPPGEARWGVTQLT